MIDKFLDKKKTNRQILDEILSTNE